MTTILPVISDSVMFVAFKFCSFQDCGRTTRSRGLCRTHYEMALTGEPLRPIRSKAPVRSALERDARGWKKCFGCEEWKAEGHFVVAERNIDGLYARCRSCVSDYRLSRYGLTLDDYSSILSAQGFRCAICRTDEPTGHQGWCVDHDHSCCPGQGSCGSCVRGLLCVRCNMGIGQMQDEPARLRAAADYLESFEKQESQ